MSQLPDSFLSFFDQSLQLPNRLLACPEMQKQIQYRCMIRLLGRRLGIESFRGYQRRNEPEQGR